MKIIKYFFEFIFVILLFVIFKLLGKKNASNFGCFIAKNIGSLFRSNKKIVKNLEIAFPDLCAEEKKKNNKKYVVQYRPDLWGVRIFR